MVKNPLATAGDVRDAVLIPGSGRSPGGGHGSPLQCSCLENPMDRGARQATVRGDTKSDTTKSSLAHTHALPSQESAISLGLGSIKGGRS